MCFKGNSPNTITGNPKKMTGGKGGGGGKNPATPVNRSWGGGGGGTGTGEGGVKAKQNQKKEGWNGAEPMFCTEKKK